jgi:hypothetical protein
MKKTNYYVEITKSNIDDYLQKYHIIICKTRNSRIKAKQIAILEMIFAQIDNDIMLITNGPLGDIKGIISFFCPKNNLDCFKEKLFGIGYCDKFYLLNFENEICKSLIELDSVNPPVWKGKKFSVEYLFCQDVKIYEKHSPHNREFKIISKNDEIKTITGYRGDGSEFGRRSLPVEDARCMVNLSIPGRSKRALDPFAGGGGIIYAYKYIVVNGTITSVDIDPILKPGLEFYGSTHYVMNAADVSFPENSFDSVITETPFSKNALNDIIKALIKINFCISNDGIFVIMCKINQYESIQNTMVKLENYLLFHQEIDRKGTEVEICVWSKNKKFAEEMKDFFMALAEIY